MTDPSARTFTADFKRFFLRGLVILLPSVLTLWIVVKAYQFIDSAIAEPINGGVRVALGHTARFYGPMRRGFDPGDEQLDAALAERAVARGIVTREAVRHELRQAAAQEPSEQQVNSVLAERAVSRRLATRDAARAELRQQKINQWWAEHWYMDLIGLVVAIVAVYVAGRLLGGFLGRRVYRRLERLITSVPVVKQVYPYVKQVVDFLFSDEQAIKFNRVVMVQYPRKGIWSLGFQTGGGLQGLSELGDAVTVFIPSSPTPFTGYTINVPRAEIIDVPITVEEAFRFVVSGGVLVPDHHRLAAPCAAVLPDAPAEPVMAGTASGAATPPGLVPSRADRTHRT